MVKNKCPRCGKVIRGYSARSRFAPVYVCSKCGVIEALEQAGFLQRNKEINYAK